jgi:hypothetical protein
MGCGENYIQCNLVRGLYNPTGKIWWHKSLHADCMIPQTWMVESPELQGPPGSGRIPGPSPGPRQAHPRKLGTLPCYSKRFRGFVTGSQAPGGADNRIRRTFGAGCKSPPAVIAREREPGRARAGTRAIRVPTVTVGMGEGPVRPSNRTPSAARVCPHDPEVCASGFFCPRRAGKGDAWYRKCAPWSGLWFSPGEGWDPFAPILRSARLCWPTAGFWARIITVPPGPSTRRFWPCARPVSGRVAPSWS